MNSLLPVITKSIARHAEDLTGLARAIYKNPETGYRETLACRRQAALLRRWRFEVRTPFANLDTAFRAEAGKQGPVFCLLSEYDALTGLGHGCGHNLIAAAALGAGRAIQAFLHQQKIPGRIVIIGTPAEESLGGKVKLVRAGGFKGLDAVMMAHPNWRTAPDTGSTSIDRYKVTYLGKAAHAAASPEKGRNALEAVMLLFQGINSWRQHLTESARVHGIITEGGQAPNIVPEQASAFVFLRSDSDKHLAGMKKRFLEIAKGAALMTGTRVVTTPSDTPYRARNPNQHLNQAYLEYASALKMTPIETGGQGRGSSDFGDVSHLLPGSHVYFSISRRQIAGHSQAMLAASGSDFGMKRMLCAAEALAHCGCRFLSQPDFRNAVLKEFRQSNLCPTA